VFDDLDDCEEHCVFAANYVWPSGSLGGEQLMIVIRPKDDAAIKDLIDGLQARNRKLADFKRLSGYIVWSEEFPRTASMKVKRNVLRDELAEHLERDSALMEL
jgi:long-chain acyl-CoA synthetase